jgi:Na+-driven multidrug efflux pump
VLLNMVIAPFAIFGWLTGVPLGVAGAGLASFLAALAAVIGLASYLARKQTFLRIDLRQWRPDWPLWGRMLMIGLPSGGEFILLSLVMGLIYYVIRGFGAEAQAGFGIGSVVMRAGFMPAVALSFGAAAVVGQNFGAKRYDRVRETFAESARIAVGFMVVFTILCHLAPAALLGIYSGDPGVIDVGADYLRFISYNYVASGLVMVSGGVFQGLGNTWPSLLASASRLVLFVAPVLWLSQQPGFTLHQVWWTSVVSVTLQALFAVALLLREFRLRLRVPEAPPAPAMAAAP